MHRYCKKKPNVTTIGFLAHVGYVGHTLMTTDGTTLLGADNKAPKS